MKKKDIFNKTTIISFVIGLLVGSIITTGIFLMIRTNDRPKMPNGFDPTTVNRSNFDKSKYPRRQRSKDSSSEKTQEETKEQDNKSVESGE